METSGRCIELLLLSDTCLRKLQVFSAMKLKSHNAQVTSENFLEVESQSFWKNFVI